MKPPASGERGRSAPWGARAGRPYGCSLRGRAAEVTTQADIDTWHDVLSVLKEDGLRDTLADLDASELDVSDMMFLQDRDIELLTLYLTFNNYKQLYTVNVSHCQLKGAGTELLVSGLVLNQTVKYLYCSDNNMGLEGAKALASYLANNDVLKTLDIGVNNIGRNGGKQLAGVFIEDRNHTLQTLFSTISKPAS